MHYLLNLIDKKSLNNLSDILNRNNAEKMKNSELALLIENIKKDLENKHLYY